MRDFLKEQLWLAPCHFFYFRSEQEGGGSSLKTCINMIKGLLILILFLIGTFFCSADLRYLTLRARVGILACKIFIYLQILFFHVCRILLFYICKIGDEKKGYVDCEQFFRFKQTN